MSRWLAGSPRQDLYIMEKQGIIAAYCFAAWIDLRVGRIGRRGEFVLHRSMHNRLH
jgi:hypothetical protein